MHWLDDWSNARRTSTLPFKARQSIFQNFEGQEEEERTLSPQWRRVALPIYLLSVRHQQQRPGALSKAFKAPTTVIHAKGPNYHAACQFSVLFSIFLELTTHPKVRECRAKLL